MNKTAVILPVFRDFMIKERRQVAVKVFVKNLISKYERYIAEILRDDFKQSNYGEVPLPFVVLRRLYFRGFKRCCS